MLNSQFFKTGEFEKNKKEYEKTIKKYYLEYKEKFNSLSSDLRKELMQNQYNGLKRGNDWLEWPTISFDEYISNL